MDAYLAKYNCKSNPLEMQMISSSSIICVFLWQLPLVFQLNRGQISVSLTQDFGIRGKVKS